ncbi:MAG TPA: Gfo/Idh/MocA family oxidoreductase [Dehalococcoidia bacterium]|nr:Gfo/Idh/MocA family oxidoreductase [Dehalococcoidia bacterium]
MVTALSQPQSIANNTVEPVRVGIVGYGYWGPNLARNVASEPLTELVAISDMNPARLDAARATHPLARLTTRARDVLEDPTIEAVVIATPLTSHYGLAMEALANGKHVLVEKPLAACVEEAAELVREARRRDLHLLVDHTFLFTGAVRKMHEYITRGRLGDVYYYDSTRINLGLFHHDTNVIWDLAPHDVAIMLHLLDQPIRSVSAVGARHVDRNVENIAYLTVRFDGPLLAHFHVNWLAPAKVRKTIIGGSERMLIYDDMEASEKLKVYDSGAHLPETPEGIHRSLVEYRTGDVVAPKLEKAEALAIECAHLARVVRGFEDPVSDGLLGLKVVRVLEAAQRSLECGGMPMEVVL